MNSKEVAATTASMNKRSKVIDDLKTKSAAAMNKEFKKLQMNDEKDLNCNKASVVNKNSLGKQMPQLNVTDYLDDEEFKVDWAKESSQFAKLTNNPVRRMIEQMKIEPNPSKQMIALSIGDPVVLSNLAKPDTVKNAIIKCLDDKKFDGYTASYGTEAARQAIADYCSRPERVVYKASDILLTSGCSQAIDLCITCLANPGDNILIPRPGFSIYKTLAGTLGINVKYYDLLEETGWECDLDGLVNQIDERTVAIIVNNPSNPCGSVFSKKHCLDILEIAEAHKLPIIADEVYGNMAFPGNECYYMAELTDTVPILSCNALSKRFMLPGWRFGWIAIHDPKNHIKNIRMGFNDLTTRILGPNSLVQGAVPEILATTPQSYYDNVMQLLAENATIVYDKLSNLPGIKPIKPSGAMYLMVRLDMDHFPGINNDLEFSQALIKEQSVFCLPASVFEMPNYLRIVITMKKEKIDEACNRIIEFVNKHYRA